MKSAKYVLVSVIILLLINHISYASLSYGTALYTNMCYSYADECHMDETIFNKTQIRINKAIYGQAAVIFSEDHYNACYSDVNTPIFNSFKKYYTPLCALSFSIAEWGGKGDIRYSFTPAIATKRLVDAGVNLDYIDPLQVNTQYYASMGVNVWDTRKYWGPLQISNDYFNMSSSYKCGYIPMDYYSWPDECQWTFHNKCNLIKQAWNKDYVFKDSYAVIAHTAIAHNSGGNHLTTQNFYLDRNWYPWKNSQAVFDYVDFITREDNIKIILEDADNYANSLIESFKNGTESGALYKSIGESRILVSKMNINWSLYVKPHWLGNMTSGAILEGDALRNWEKVMYPVQSIWNYRVLEKLYGLVD